jgi:hypothetical protein
MVMEQSKECVNECHYTTGWIRFYSRVGLESFAFPINVQQVFYCDAEENSAWKVVCRMDIRSR